MKLKLSNLLVLIGIIFFSYYYFIYSPCQAAAGEKKLQPPIQEMNYPNYQGTPLDMNYQGTPLDMNYQGTPLDMNYPDESYESFNVTPIHGVDGDYGGDYGDYGGPVDSRYTAANAYNPYVIDKVAGNVRPDNVMEVAESVTYL